MTEHALFYYPHVSFTNEQLPLLRVAASYLAKLVPLNPVGGSGCKRLMDGTERRRTEALRR